MLLAWLSPRRVAAPARPGRLRGRGAVGLVRPPAVRRRRGRRSSRRSAGRVRVPRMLGADHPRRHRALLVVALVADLQQPGPACGTASTTPGRRSTCNFDRRYDLIPNLVEAVKGYAAHERATFEAVTTARGRAAQQAQGVAQQAQAENALAAARPPVRGRRGLPGASADENFHQFQTELSETESALPSPARSSTTPFSPTTTRSKPCRASSSPAPSASSSGTSSRSEERPGGAAGSLLTGRVTLARPSSSPAEAAAKFYTLPCPHVLVRVEADGSLRIDEDITPSARSTRAPTATSSSATVS